MEYFIDTDPGFGNGTAINVTTNASVNTSLIVPLSAVSNGFHTFYLRAKDSNGRWSLVQNVPFYKEVAPMLPNLIAMEYFIDTDPGFGNGTALSITASTDINQSFISNFNSLSLGTHKIYMRVKDSLNHWSLTQSDSFIVNNTALLVGKTTYDLQTNGSAPNRLQMGNNGEIYAAFTGSLQASPFSDRGTFVQSYNGTNWQPQPSARIESTRTGWPALVVTATGKQFIVSHNGSIDGLVINTRNNATLAWTSSSLNIQGMWPRAVSSGGDTIHMICQNSQYGSNKYVKYFRSINAGLTWDINGVMLAGSDSIGGYNWDFSTEGYSIDAKGNTVAIVLGGQSNKMVLFKSTDVGSSFSTKVINEAPLPYIDGNKVFTNFVTPSKFHSVSVGNNSLVHFFAGKMVIFDNDSTDNTWYYYPSTDSLMYWNDNMQPNSISSILGMNCIGYGYNYTHGVIGSLSSAYDYANQKLSVVFDARGLVFGGYKDLYYVQSVNNGTSFTTPVQLTTDAQNGFENIFPSIAKSNDNNIHILWQKMNRQGFNTDPNIAFDTAYLYYQKVSPTSSKVHLNLTAFLQGFYLGGNSMTSGPFNADGISPITVADTISVELHEAASPFPLVYSVQDTVDVTGHSNIQFPEYLSGKYYYLSIKHRNSIETWSGDSVLMSPTTNYDFSTSANKAYGGNMADDGSGVFLIYSGDINQDGAVDFNDYPNLDISSSNGVLGYDSNDLNGDASVDFNDYPILDINSSNGVLSVTP